MTKYTVVLKNGHSFQVETTACLAEIMDNLLNDAAKMVNADLPIALCDVGGAIVTPSEVAAIHPADGEPTFLDHDQPAKHLDLSPQTRNGVGFIYSDGYQPDALTQKPFNPSGGEQSKAPLSAGELAHDVKTHPDTLLKQGLRRRSLLELDDVLDIRRE